MEGVNIRLLREEIERQVIKNADAIFNKEIKPIVTKKFKALKQELLDSFDEHDVTQEIEGGPSADSKFVKTIAGGNLFSLLGFNGGENPTAELRKVIKEKVNLKIESVTRKNTKNGILWEIPVEMPTLGEIEKEAASRNPLDWTSRGWTYLIEHGIPWFAHYLFRERGFKTSKSGTAIEVKGTISQGRTSIHGTPYISEIMRKFQDAISNK